MQVEMTGQQLNVRNWNSNMRPESSLEAVSTIGLLAVIHFLLCYVWVEGTRVGRRKHGGHKVNPYKLYFSSFLVKRLLEGYGQESGGSQRYFPPLCYRRR